MEVENTVRSQIMRAVKDKNTAPEMFIRKILYSHGYRYRIHVSELAGKPDIVFRSKKKVIFVHGCFWHGHDCKRGDRKPNTNRNYWSNKIERNRQRDTSSVKILTEAGWDVLIIWECENRDSLAITTRILNFLK